MHSAIVLTLKHDNDNPRNSEGAFATLKDGGVIFAYTRFNGGHNRWDDHESAEICARVSHDQGLTWSDSDRVLVKNTGKMNLMSVSLLRLQNDKLALFYLEKNSISDLRLQMRLSADEGVSWSSPVCCMPSPGYNVVNNDRVIQLSSGRLVAPAAYHRVRMHEDKQVLAPDPCGLILHFLSDDNGKTWREGLMWRTIAADSPAVAQEPGVVECKNGDLYGFFRTDQGRQYQMFSRDGGENWSVPTPSCFLSPRSPMSIKRLPTGEWLAVWNDHSGRWPIGNKTGISPMERCPLVCALSRDDGNSWSDAKLIEGDSHRGFCYTTIHPLGEYVLLAYCCGGSDGHVLQDCCIRRLDREWLLSV